MNGNVALISRAVVQRVGNVDPAFVQQMADFDYGLRARAAGCSVWVAPARSAPAPLIQSVARASGPRRELRRLWSVKELKHGPWAVYSGRWAGRLWPCTG